jgi:hypothetical protein
LIFKGFSINSVPDFPDGGGSPFASWAFNCRFFSSYPMKFCQCEKNDFVEEIKGFHMTQKWKLCGVGLLI